MQAIQKIILILLIILIGSFNPASGEGSSTDLVYAAMGDLAAVRKMVASGADVNIKDEYGVTPLMAAASVGNYEIAVFLISKGAKINVRNNTGMTPLMQAAMGGNKQLVQLLLAKGADPGARDKDGNTAVYFATLFSHKEIADLLLAQTSKAGSKNSLSISEKNRELNQVFLSAVVQNDLPRVKELVAKGASLETSAPEDGDTILHYAVANNNIAMAEFAISKGININAANNRGDTPLHIAVALGRVSFAKLLLSKGALADIANNALATPLYEVTQYCRGQLSQDYRQIIDLLLAHGADINRPNGGDVSMGKMTALHGTVAGSNPALAEYLLAKGAKLEAKSSDGWTPLHLAVVSSNRVMVEFFIKKGANVNAADNSGKTPLQSAKVARNNEIAALISKAGGK